MNGPDENVQKAGDDALFDALGRDQKRFDAAMGLIKKVGFDSVDEMHDFLVESAQTMNVLYACRVRSIMETEGNDAIPTYDDFLEEEFVRSGGEPTVRMRKEYAKYVGRDYAKLTKSAFGKVRAEDVVDGLIRAFSKE